MKTDRHFLETTAFVQREPKRREPVTNQAESVTALGWNQVAMAQAIAKHAQGEAAAAHREAVEWMADARDGTRNSHPRPYCLYRAAKCQQRAAGFALRARLMMGLLD